MRMEKVLKKSKYSLLVKLARLAAPSFPQLNSHLVPQPLFLAASSVFPKLSNFLLSLAANACEQTRASRLKKGRGVLAALLCPPHHPFCALLCPTVPYCAPTVPTPPPLFLSPRPERTEDRTLGRACRIPIGSWEGSQLSSLSETLIARFQSRMRQSSI